VTPSVIKEGLGFGLALGEEVAGGEGVAVGVALEEASAAVAFEGRDLEGEEDDPAARAADGFELLAPPLSASTATQTPMPTITATSAHGTNQEKTDL
jgi:hypothetical protein